MEWENKAAQYRQGASYGQESMKASNSRAITLSFIFPSFLVFYGPLQNPFLLLVYLSLCFGSSVFHLQPTPNSVTGFGYVGAYRESVTLICHPYSRVAVPIKDGSRMIWGQGGRRGGEQDPLPPPPSQLLVLCSIPSSCAGLPAILWWRQEIEGSGYDSSGNETERRKESMPVGGG